MMLAAVVEGVDGDLMNLGNGDEISIAELATTLLGLMGNPIEAQLGALPERPVEVPRMFCDPSRARRLLGWTSSRSLRDGLLDTIDWYRAQRIRGAEPS
jgi:UDP-glucose 4-epimerase